MQLAAIEFARHVLGIDAADSQEFNEDRNDLLIHLMESQKDVKEKGGTMRLGAYPCELSLGTKAYQAYGRQQVSERHRHRFEFNNDFRDSFEEHGMIFSGLSPDGHLVEMMELRDHPWFVACQFHPELKSSPSQPHPLFRDFVSASLGEGR
jgi:CTP synthase